MFFYECNANFAPQKALKAHMRRKHNIRRLQRFYADSNGLCPVCRTDFRTRFRCLAHLCDSRRTRCWSVIQGNPRAYPKLTIEEVAARDEIDRQLKREAWQAGHTHVLASKPAVTAAGKQIGHVSK